MFNLDHDSSTTRSVWGALLRDREENGPPELTPRARAYLDALDTALAAERAERQPPGRGWAAMMLALDVRVYESILLGRPVMVRRLDEEVLRRALRGAAPRAGEFIRVTSEHLDAIDECGPLAERRSRP